MTAILLMTNINLKLMFLTVEIVNSQIKNRFERMLKIENLFGFLRPKTLVTLSENELLKSRQQNHKNIIAMVYQKIFRCN